MPGYATGIPSYSQWQQAGQAMANPGAQGLSNTPSASVLGTNTQIPNIGSTPVNLNQAFSSGGLTLDNPPPPSNNNNNNNNNNSGLPSNPQVNQQANGQRWTGTQWVPVGQGGGGGPDYQSLINQVNDVYSPGNNYLQNLANNILPQTAQNTIQGLQTSHDTQTGLIPQILQTLMNPIQQNMTAFGQQAESAASKAAKQYQAWQQQIGATLGGQTSAAQGAGELAYQQFLQGQQDLANQGSQANLKFADMQNQANLFVQQKKADLDNWLNEAKTTVQNNFTNAISQVTADLSLNNEQQQQAKLEIMSNAANQQQALSLAHEKFNQDLTLFSQLSNPQSLQNGIDTTGANTIGGKQMDQTAQNAMAYNLINQMGGTQLPQYNLNAGAGANNLPSLNIGGGFFGGTKPQDQNQQQQQNPMTPPNITQGILG